jgi:hypothetical protein
MEWPIEYRGLHRGNWYLRMLRSRGADPERRGRIDVTCVLCVSGAGKLL